MGPFDKKVDITSTTQLLEIQTLSPTVKTAALYGKVSVHIVDALPTTVTTVIINGDVPVPSIEALKRTVTQVVLVGDVPADIIKAFKDTVTTVAFDSDISVRSIQAFKPNVTHVSFQPGGCCLKKNQVEALKPNVIHVSFFSSWLEQGCFAALKKTVKRVGLYSNASSCIEYDELKGAVTEVDLDRSARGDSIKLLKDTVAEVHLHGCVEAQSVMALKDKVKIVHLHGDVKSLIVGLLKDTVKTLYLDSDVPAATVRAVRVWKQQHPNSVIHGLPPETTVYNAPRHPQVPSSSTISPPNSLNGSSSSAIPSNSCSSGDLRKIFAAIFAQNQQQMSLMKQVLTKVNETNTKVVELETKISGLEAQIGSLTSNTNTSEENCRKRKGRPTGETNSNNGSPEKRARLGSHSDTAVNTQSPQLSKPSSSSSSSFPHNNFTTTPSFFQSPLPSADVRETYASPAANAQRGLNEIANAIPNVQGGNAEASTIKQELISDNIPKFDINE